MFRPWQPRSFEDDEALLVSVLADVIRDDAGEEVLQLHDRAVVLAQQARGGDEAAAESLAALVAGLDPARLEVLIRSLTRWFQLVNLAEDNERVRRLARHAAQDGPAGRRGSLHAAVDRLAQWGTTAQDIAAVLATAEIRLVMTAHPTEARRRTTIEKLARVFAILRDLDTRPATPHEEAAAREHLLAVVEELWGSDEVRTASPTVLDEVRAGLVYFTSTLVDVVPGLYRELERAVGERFPDEPVRTPPVLTFGSWMGGDRDGNPHVTPEVTVEALETMRTECLAFLERRVDGLIGHLSLSSRLTGEPDALSALLADGARRFPDLRDRIEHRNAHEPYRRALTYVRARIRATRDGTGNAYGGPRDLLADLEAVRRALAGAGGRFVAAGELHDFIRQVEVFGFHFALLDVREHANRHRHALGEILAVLGMEEDYAGLPEVARMRLLVRAIEERRPLIPADLSGFTEPTRRVVETFHMLFDSLTGHHAGAVRSYIVSGTGGPADILEVLLLMKECRLARAGGAGARLRIVPLFEAGDTLEAAADTMRALLAEPVYRTALRAVGDRQEIMIGYSDSNKDVGYVASGWATYLAQVALADVLREHDVEWMFFHGRGGAVGRGGGRANVAIISQPPGTVGGHFKVTEQGEVLSARYSVPEIAHRELELTASAVLVSTLNGVRRVTPERFREFRVVVEEMAETSCRMYRDLVYGDPGLPVFFRAATPLEEISRLRLGSRPAKRGEVAGIQDYRAIPWVFSWTQARVVLPAWYGLGTALEQAVEAHGLALLREMRSDWPFFGALVSNAEMACAKADMTIGRRYAELCEDEEIRERVWGKIEHEFARTSHLLVCINGGERLLDGEPVLRDSIDRRNPFVDPLSFIQIELLRRVRAGASGEDVARASLLAVNGIASGLRNTG